MKNKRNPLKINKTIQRGILLFVIFILVLSIFILILSLFSDKRLNLKPRSYVSGQFSNLMHRHFIIESEAEHLYNLGEYQVNLNTNKILIINLSIQAYSESFELLNDHSIIVQNAVIETFANQHSMYIAQTKGGKEKIKKELLKNINNSLHKPLVAKIYFNKFLIQ